MFNLIDISIGILIGYLIGTLSTSMHAIRTIEESMMNEGIEPKQAYEATRKLLKLNKEV